MAKGPNNLETLVQGLDEGLYGRLRDKLRQRNPPIAKEHFKMLTLLRNQDKADGRTAPSATDVYAVRPAQNKYQLYLMVVDVLLELSGPDAMGRTLRMELETGMMLRHMGHLHQSIDWLRKAQKRATEACDHVLLLECLDMERIVLKDIAGSQKQQEDNRSAIRAALATLDAVAELRMLADEMLSISRSGRAMEGSAATIRANEMLSHPLLREDKADTSFKARSYRLSFLTIYHRWMADIPKALQFSEEHLSLWDLHPEMVVHMPQAYTSAVSNALTYSLLLGRTDKWAELRPRFDHNALGTGALKADMFRAIEMTYLLHRLQNHDFEGVAADRKRLLTDLDRFERHLPASFIMSMKCNLGMHAWLMADVRPARRILLEVKDGPHSRARPDAVVMALVVTALMDIDKGDFGPDQTKKLRNKLAQYPKASALMALLTEHLPLLVQHMGTAQQKTTFNLALADLREASGTLKGAPGTEEYCLWLLHRTTGRSLRELFTEEAHREVLGG